MDPTPLNKMRNNASKLQRAAALFPLTIRRVADEPAKIQVVASCSQGGFPTALYDRPLKGPQSDPILHHGFGGAIILKYYNYSKEPTPNRIGKY